MENILTIITIVEAVVIILHAVSVFRYLKKDTTLSLVGCAVSSVCMCALEIIGLLIKSNLNQSYESSIALIVIYGISFLIGIFCMGLKFGSKSNPNITVRIIETDENESNEGNEEK